MDPSNRIHFIEGVSASLGYPGMNHRDSDLFAAEMSAENRAMLERVRGRDQADREQLLDRLMAEAPPVNLRVTPCPETSDVTAEIIALVQEREPEWGGRKTVVAWRHPAIAKLDLEPALSNVGIPLSLAGPDGTGEGTTVSAGERTAFRQEVTDAYIGITSADYCIADTATLVLRTRPGQPRTVSLVPSIHVAVIDLHRIIADLNELYTLIKWGDGAEQAGLTNCLTFVSGPSKTADIEATMVHGAHGPREVHLYVVTGQMARDPDRQ